MKDGTFYKKPRNSNVSVAINFITDGVPKAL